MHLCRLKKNLSCGVKGSAHPRDEKNTHLSLQMEWQAATSSLLIHTKWPRLPPALHHPMPSPSAVSRHLNSL